jgi:hypothetical protein
MTRGKREQERFQFSGHETFALRHGWLKKVVDTVADSQTDVFRLDDAIAHFGVGRNMVSSMRHWATTLDIILPKDRPDEFELDELGSRIFDNNQSNGALDPYLENPLSLWLLHWKLTESITSNTTWHYAFHLYSRTNFDRKHLSSAIVDFSRENDQPKVAEKTIQRDVDCFVSTYVMKRGRDGEAGEESIECPLAELGLIKELPQRGHYEFRIGPKPDLPDAMFLYALHRFMSSGDGATTASLERITFDPGSPGRVFKLDENSIAERLSEINSASQGIFEWSETASLREVQLLNADVDPFEHFIVPAYGDQGRSEAA